MAFHSIDGDHDAAAQRFECDYCHIKLHFPFVKSGEHRFCDPFCWRDYAELVGVLRTRKDIDDATDKAHEWVNRHMADLDY